MVAGMYEDMIPLKDKARMDKICETQAEDAAFFAALHKGPALTQLTYEWMLQFRDRVGHEGAIDGQDQTEFDAQERVAAKARAQEFRQPWRVTQKTEYTVQIGGKEVPRQKLIASLKLREKVQSRCLSDSGPVMGQRPTIADETAGAFWWFFNPASPFFTLEEKFRVSAGALYNGSLAAYHEETLEGQLAQAFKDRNGGTLTLDCWSGVDFKRRLAKFSAVDTENNGEDNLRVYSFNGASKHIIRCVDMLTMGEAVVRVHPTTYLLRAKANGASHADAHRSALFLDMKKWHFHFNKTWSHFDNSNEGGGQRGFWWCSGLLQPETLTGQMAVRCNG